MKGFRFYADIPGTRYNPDKSPYPRGKLRSDITVEELKILAETGTQINVVALFTGEEHRCPGGSQEAIAAVFTHVNSAVACTSISYKYLRRCRRIPESVARQLHPRLFGII